MNRKVTALYAAALLVFLLSKSTFAQTTIFGMTLGRPLPAFAECTTETLENEKPCSEGGALRNLPGAVNAVITVPEELNGNIESVYAKYKLPMCGRVLTGLLKKFGEPTKSGQTTAQSGVGVTIPVHHFNWTFKNGDDLDWVNPEGEADECLVMASSRRWRSHQEKEQAVNF